METQQVIQHFEQYRLTKLFLIDMFGTIFNSRSQFYAYLGGKFTKIENIFLTWSSGLLPDSSEVGEISFRNSSTNSGGNMRPYKNLLVLTVLTEKLKHLLNKTLHVEFEKYSQWMLKKAVVDGKSNDVSTSSDTVRRSRRNATGNESIDYTQHPVDSQEVSRKNDENVQSDPEEDYLKDKQVTNQGMSMSEISDTEKWLVNFVRHAFIEESRGSGARRWRRQTTQNSHPTAPQQQQPQNQLVYMSILYGANESGIKFDFIVLDLHQNVNTKNESTFGWRPFLILQQNHINHQVFTSHPFLRGFRDWGLDTSEFWTCGTLCWGVIGLAIFLLLCIIVASVWAGVAVRLTKALRRCCVAGCSSYRNSGGPEVDKPDLLKGSIGSLKNLGLASAAKNNSGSGSLARHHTVIDVRARYNGDLVQLKEIPLMAVTELKTKAMDILMTAHGLRHENINPLI
uniref:Uncharacterized protein n=1 Tax=Lutzomyia longipalpis TaxID=7200 RepID=A0A1B0CW74_LUTLO